MSKRHGAIRTDPIDSAHDGGLLYVRGEAGPGIVRRKRGRGFVYFAADGKRVRDHATLDRIRALVIPPAWARVWICPQRNGHLQAVGRDAKGRKQYRYHPQYRRIRDQVKFDRMLFFGPVLPRIRRRVRHDLKLPGMPKEKVLAAVVRLLDETFARVGNDEYLRSNGSSGLTTLENKHARVRGAELRLHFRGKSGQILDLSLRDNRLARIVKRCQHLPGEELFQYQAESGELQVISSGDVNDYLREITGQDITAKDFRTWHGTRQMFMELNKTGPASSKTEAKKKILSAVKETASQLGNRPATCRKYYIHPAVVESYLSEKMFRMPRGKLVRTQLRGHEAAMLALLKEFHSPNLRAQSTRARRKPCRRISKVRTWALAS
jgi:DNA topoisomerase-1